MSSRLRRSDGLEALPSRRNLMMYMHYNEWPRVSMFVCIAAAMSVGLLVTKGLLFLGVETLWARYLPALVAAYASFFIAIWMWLHMSRYGRHLRSDRRDGGDGGLDFPSGGGSSSGPSGAPRIDAGGGGFDGGGASASFDGGPLDAPSLDLPSVDVDFDIGGGDDGGIVAIIAGIVLVLAAVLVFGAALYVVYQAPVILTEVVFEVMLGSALVRRTRGAATRDWSGVLFRRTWKPFALLALMALLFAGFAGVYAPEARTALEVLHHSSSTPHR